MVNCRVASIKVLKQVPIIEIEEEDEDDNENDLIESILNKLEKGRR